MADTETLEPTTEETKPLEEENKPEIIYLGPDLKKKVDEQLKKPEAEREELRGPMEFAGAALGAAWDSAGDIVKGIYNKAVDPAGVVTEVVPPKTGTDKSFLPPKKFRLEDLYDPATGAIDVRRLPNAHIPKELRAEIENNYLAYKSKQPVEHFERWQRTGSIPTQEESKVKTGVKEVVGTASEMLGDIPQWAYKKLKDISPTPLVKGLPIPPEWEREFKSKYGERIKAALTTSGGITVDLDGLDVDVVPGETEAEVLRAAYDKQMTQFYDAYQDATRSGGREISSLAIPIGVNVLGGVASAAKLGKTAAALEALDTAMSPAAKAIQYGLKTDVAAAKFAPLINFIEKNPHLSNMALQTIDNMVMQAPQASTTLDEDLKNRAIAGAATVPIAGTFEALGKALGGKGLNLTPHRVERGAAKAREIHASGKGLEILKTQDLPPEVKNPLLDMEANKLVKDFRGDPNRKMDPAFFQEAVMRSPHDDPVVKEVLNLIALNTSGGTMDIQAKRQATALARTKDRNINLDDFSAQHVRENSDVQDLLRTYAPYLGKSDTELLAAAPDHFREALRAQLARETPEYFARKEMLRAFRNHLPEGELDDVSARDVHARAETMDTALRNIRDREMKSDLLLEKHVATADTSRANMGRAYDFASKVLDNLEQNHPQFRDHIQPVRYLIENAMDSKSSIPTSSVRPLISALRREFPREAGQLERSIGAFNRRRNSLDKAVRGMADEHMKNHVIETLGYAHDPGKGTKNNSEALVNQVTYHPTSSDSHRVIYDHMAPLLKSRPVESKTAMLLWSKQVSEALGKREAVPVQLLEQFDLAFNRERLVASQLRDHKSRFVQAVRNEDDFGAEESLRNIQELFPQFYPEDMSTPRVDLSWYRTALDKVFSKLKDGSLKPADLREFSSKTITMEEALGRGHKPIVDDLLKGLRDFNNEIALTARAKEKLIHMESTGDYTELPLLLSNLNRNTRTFTFHANLEENLLLMHQLAPLMISHAEHYGLSPSLGAEWFRHLTAGPIIDLRLEASGRAAARTQTEIQNIFDAQKYLSRALLDRLDVIHESQYGIKLDREMLLAQLVDPRNGFSTEGYAYLMVNTDRTKAMALINTLNRERVGEGAQWKNTEAWEAGLARETGLSPDFTFEALAMSRRNGMSAYGEFIQKYIFGDKAVKEKMRGVWASKEFGDASNRLDGVYGFKEFYDSQKYDGEYVEGPLLQAHKQMFLLENERTRHWLTVGDAESFQKRASILLNESLQIGDEVEKAARVEELSRHLWEYWRPYKTERSGFWEEIYSFRKWWKATELEHYKHMEKKLKQQNEFWRGPESPEFSMHLWREQRVFNKRWDRYDLSDFDNRDVLMRTDHSREYSSGDSGQMRKANDRKNGDLVHPLRSLLNQIRSDTMGIHSLHARAAFDAHAVNLGLLGFHLAKTHVQTWMSRSIITMPLFRQFEDYLLRTPGLSQVLSGTSLLTQILGGGTKVFMSLNRISKILKNISQSYFQAAATSSKLNTGWWNDIPVAGKIIEYFPFMYRTLDLHARGFFKGGNIQFRGLEPKQNRVVNKVLNGFKDANNLNRLRLLSERIDAVSSSNLAGSSGTLYAGEMAVAQFRDFVTTYMKEASEESTSANHLGMAAALYNQILTAGKSKGEMAEAFQPLLPVRTPGEIGHLVATIDANPDAGLRNFLIMWHADNAGRFGRDATPLVVHALSQISPNSARFFSASTAAAYRLLHSTQAAMEWGKAIMVRSGQTKPTYSTAYAAALLPKMALWALAAHVATEGTPTDTVEDALGKDEDSNRYTRLLKYGFTKALGFDAQEFSFAPTSKAAKSKGAGAGATIDLGFMSTDLSLLALVHPDIPNTVSAAKDYWSVAQRAGIPGFTTPEMEKMKARAQAETDPVARNLILEKIFEQEALNDRFFRDYFLDALARNSPLSPTNWLIGVGKNPTLTADLLWHDQFDGIVLGESLKPGAISPLSHTFYALGLSESPYSASVTERARGLYLHLVAEGYMSESEAAVHLLQATQKLDSMTAAYDRAANFAATLDGMSQEQKDQKSVVDKVSGAPVTPPYNLPPMGKEYALPGMLLKQNRELKKP